MTTESFQVNDYIKISSVRLGICCPQKGSVSQQIEVS